MTWQGEIFRGKIGFTMEDYRAHWDPHRAPA
jgi:hypothetical protein